MIRGDGVKRDGGARNARERVQMNLQFQFDIVCGTRAIYS